jgi:hypothetical protein
MQRSDSTSVRGGGSNSSAATTRSGRAGGRELIGDGRRGCLPVDLATRQCSRTWTSTSTRTVAGKRRTDGDAEQRVALGL